MNALQQFGRSMRIKGYHVKRLKDILPTWRTIAYPWRTGIIDWRRCQATHEIKLARYSDECEASVQYWKTIGRYKTWYKNHVSNRSRRFRAL